MYMFLKGMYTHNKKKKKVQVNALDKQHLAIVRVLHECACAYQSHSWPYAQTYPPG